jgi:GTP-binding protein LepA
MELIQRKRGTDLTTKPIDETKWMFTCKLPWGEVVQDFHERLKNVTQGYGSVDTTEADPPFAKADLSKVDIQINGEVVGPLSFVCHEDEAHGEGRNVCKKVSQPCRLQLFPRAAVNTSVLTTNVHRFVSTQLQEVLPRQQFVTIIQAVAGGKIVAGERIKAYRKDVLTKSGKTVGGGDQTRKMKLLDKQKKGKKRMQQGGRVTLSQEAFNSVITRSS